MNATGTLPIELMSTTLVPTCSDTTPFSMIDTVPATAFVNPKAQPPVVQLLFPPNTKFSSNTTPHYILNREINICQNVTAFDEQ